MTISEWQSQVDKWIKEYGVRYFDIKTNNLLLMEEVGELSRHIARKYGEQNYKRPTQSEEGIKDEMGDILFVLTCMANQMEIDLTEILKKNIDKKTNRDKTRHHNNQKLKD